MGGLKEYKCPACGGALEWNGIVQKMKCPYCDSVYTLVELEQLEKRDGEKTAEEAAAESDNAVFSEEETAGMKMYSCDSCGARLMAAETAGAMKCPYCSSNVVMTGQFAGDRRPDVIIPFRNDKKFAREQLRRHVRSRSFVPRVFTAENHIDEVKAVYVPFWLYDVKASVTVEYQGEKSSATRSGNMENVKKDIYSLHRSGTIDFLSVPVDASGNISNELTEAVEPYDSTKAVEFNPAYLAGFLADRYDVPEADCVSRVEERIRESAGRVFNRTLGGYTNISVLSSQVDILEKKVRYGLYPMWILNTSWRGEKYLFAINGQTGRIVGDLPLDKGMYYRRWGLLAGIIGLIIYFLTWYFF